MNNTDPRIDRILQALATTETPNGLENRVNERITFLAITPGARPSSATLLNAITRLLTSSSSLTAAVAGLVLLAVVFLSFLSQRKPQSIAKHQTPPTLVTQLQPEPVAIARALPPTEPLSATHRRLALTASPSLEAPADPDALALAETLAPSHPTPPTLPTQQERLMLNVLHSGDQQQIAALDPAEREASFARERADFHNFFAPPTPAPMHGDKP